jgi:arginase family enzyme
MWRTSARSAATTWPWSGRIGIGGWIGNHAGVRVAEEIDTTVITMFGVEELGVQRAMEIALEIAWKDADAVHLSFDIDVIDPGYAPGTGTPEPGGMTPREALKAVRMVAREGLVGMDLVEIAPPYDVADGTSQSVHASSWTPWRRWSRTVIWAAG